VYLVGFPIEMYYDAQSYKRQTYKLILTFGDLRALNLALRTCVRKLVSVG